MSVNARSNILYIYLLVILFILENDCYLKQAQCLQIDQGFADPVTLLHDGRCSYASTNQSRNVCGIASCIFFNP